MTRLRALAAMLAVAALPSAACLIRTDTIAAPARAPLGEPAAPVRAFYCTRAAPPSDAGACSRTRAGCRDHQTALLDAGVFVEPCAGQSQAACFTATRTLDVATFELCFPTAAACAAQRDLKLRWAGYQGVTTCQPRP